MYILIGGTAARATWTRNIGFSWIGSCANLATLKISTCIMSINSQHYVLISHVYACYYTHKVITLWFCIVEHTTKCISYHLVWTHATLRIKRKHPFAVYHFHTLHSRTQEPRWHVRQVKMAFLLHSRAKLFGRHILHNAPSNVWLCAARESDHVRHSAERGSGASVKDGLDKSRLPCLIPAQENPDRNWIICSELPIALGGGLRRRNSSWGCWLHSHCARCP